MDELKTRVLFSKDAIAHRVAELGRQISQDYQGESLVVLGALKGSVIFLSDIVRSITVPLQLDFISVSSYEGTTSLGQITTNYSFNIDLTNQHVLLIEDIVDTGLTLQHLLALLKDGGPKSLKVCTLLNKPEAHQLSHLLDYIGFNISKEFVIGYGLDLNENYRNLPSILQVIEES